MFSLRCQKQYKKVLKDNFPWQHSRKTRNYIQLDVILIAIQINCYHSTAFTETLSFEQVMLFKVNFKDKSFAI